MKRSFLTKFWEKVNKDGPVVSDNKVWKDIIGTKCWSWTGSIKKSGYGKCYKEINKIQKTMTSSRVSWEIHNGEIHENLLVCHKCDVRNCVNPDHLFLGTQKENMVDMSKKGRGSNPPFRRKLKCFGKKTKLTLSEDEISKLKDIIPIHYHGYLFYR